MVKSFDGMDAWIVLQCDRYRGTPLSFTIMCNGDRSATIVQDAVVLAAPDLQRTDALDTRMHDVHAAEQNAGVLSSAMPVSQLPTL